MVVAPLAFVFDSCVVVALALVASSLEFELRGEVSEVAPVRTRFDRALDEIEEVRIEERT